MLYTTLLLAVAIAVILLLSARWKFSAFFVLLFVAAITGIAAGFDGERIIALLKTGLGSTIEKIGLLIVLGTTLGVLLEKAGATASLARAVLGLTGEERAPLALSVIGFGVGFPIFCDSGFVVLSGLAVSLSAQSPGRRVWLVVSLATALYAVHCLVPPHPGITAAAGTLGADIGRTMLLGAVAALPAAVVGYFWAKWVNRRGGIPPVEVIDYQAIQPHDRLPSPFWAALPVVTPVALIAVKSLVLLEPTPISSGLLSFIKVAGDPVTALLIGIVLCLPLFPKIEKSTINTLLEAALVKSGGILLITAAGGAFGEVIKALNLGEVFGPAFAASGLGLLIPFALAAVFKTAQGSSTVAVISAASILAPLLPSLGFDSENSRIFALLAMGAGSMAVSHTNDSYFWVVSRFGQLDTNTALRSYSTASVWMGLTGLVAVWILTLIL
ncbi:MAG: GntP family permease [Saprospiraceae bacterium]|nr:GntP family permease [Saprospiraceae bacterium]